MKWSELNPFKKKDVVPTAPGENNGPSAAMPDASAGVPPVIMDPLVTARPPMSEQATVAPAPEPSTIMGAAESVSSAPTVDASAITTVDAPTIASTPDVAPIGAASTEQPASTTTVTSEQAA